MPPASPALTADDLLAAKRMRGLLDYVEALVKLDENVATRLAQHKLADGSQFILHQHELSGIPGLALDMADEDGPVWLRMERLVRTRPPEPAPEIEEWIVVSQDPDKVPEVKEVLYRRVDKAERDHLIAQKLVREEDAPVSLKADPTDPPGTTFYDVMLRLEDQATILIGIDAYISEPWPVWAQSERPRRKSIAIYQRLFQIAQALGMGGEQAELVWGLGLAKWRKTEDDIDVPLIERGTEIEIAHGGNAAITIRPRDQGARVELRPFQRLAGTQFNLAEDAARKALREIENAEPEGLSPFRRETFEPILRLCRSQLDVEGRYLPDHMELPAASPMPPAEGGQLHVSDRYVLFARRRSANSVLNDIEKLKTELGDDADAVALTGAARTLVMGPQDGTPDYEPLGDTIGSTSANAPDASDELAGGDHGDLFFPKPFNDDQVAIIRRLEKSDGIVVQGPPGTGKTHTIANIISHMLATGRRVLVVSHGEGALGVIRDQLPEDLRDLAISVTTSEREGTKQVERAVQMMLQIVQSIAENPSRPRQRIAELERGIVAKRKQLATIDNNIAEIAEKHLTAVPGGDRQPIDVAKDLMAARDSFAWFTDRPAKLFGQSNIETEWMAAAFRARAELGDDLQYIGARLPNLADLPNVETIRLWRDDLLRAQELEEGNAHAALCRRVIAKLGVPDTQALAQRIRQLAQDWTFASQQAWSAALLSKAFARDPGFLTLRPAVMALADEARNLAARQMPFATRRVTLPTELPGREELQTIIGMLATGQNPFSMFAWKLKRHREIVRQFAINGQSVADKDGWRHIASYLAFQADAGRLQVQWAGLHRDLVLGDGDAHDFSSFGSMARFSELVGHACKLPEGIERLRQDIAVLIADERQTRYLTAGVQSLRELLAALDRQISSIRLKQTAADVSAASERIPKDGTDLNVWATKFLEEHIPQKQYAIDKLLGTWKHLLERMAVVRGHGHRYSAIELAAAALAEAGAPALAERLRTEPSSKASGDPIPQDWREAWDWAVQFEYLASISAGTRLRELTSIRSEVEHSRGDDLGALVRERTFYALHGTMTGASKAALQAFGGLIRKIGKGTGKKAAMMQSGARQAMLNCYGAVPCWIMPSWRVSEQLPSTFATFDLVIMDEASQSDAKELPALLRGKKVLIVGDDRQVSPTAAFIKISDTQRLKDNFLKEFPYPDFVLPGASVYELARVMFPDKFVMLKEHFRCVEPIIRFSMQFYNEPLLPLRVPTAAERLTPPLVDIFVEDGMRDPKRKINMREAEVIVEEIERIIGDPSLVRISGTERRRSIGVISLIGSEQAHLIQKMLIERIGEVTYVDHNIVCGDSATLQGNERDIVFLSMITDNSRRSAQTAAQYEQRFNVAMSRARDRLVLVRSVTEAGLNPADLKAKVIRHFHDPMPTRISANQDLIELCQSSFEREIFNRLTQAGYSVTPQVGAKGFSIDMVVEGGNGRRLAIELDGDRFHGPERWADDMRRQRILERVGWVFWRCFGSTYTMDPEGTFGDLAATLARLEITPNGTIAMQQAWTERRNIAPRKVMVLSSDQTASRDAGQRLVPPAISSRPLAIGDRVVIEYVETPPGKPQHFEITAAASDRMNGLLNIDSPLAKLLSESDVGDEVTLRLEGTDRTILYRHLQENSSFSIAAE